MSYPVRVVVRETVRDSVRTQDELALRLCDDPVLRKPGARQRLRDELATRGWESTGEGDTFEKRLDPGVHVRWDLDANELRLAADASTELERSASRELRGDSMTRDGAGRQEREMKEAGAELLRKQLQERIDRERGDVEKDLLDDVHDRLEAAHDSVMAEVNDVLEAVYREWLTSQARTLGNVVGQHESVSADGEVYELTIRINQ